MWNYWADLLCPTLNVHILLMTYQKAEASSTTQLAGGRHREGKGPVEQGCSPSNIGMCEQTLSTCGGPVTAPAQEGRGHQASLQTGDTGHAESWTCSWPQFLINCSYQPQIWHQNSEASFPQTGWQSQPSWAFTTYFQNIWAHTWKKPGTGTSGLRLFHFSVIKSGKMMQLCLKFGNTLATLSYFTYFPSPVSFTGSKWDVRDLEEDKRECFPLLIFF